MEKDEEQPISNADVLSQSYSQGIEKISGLIKISGFDFHIPKEIIEGREKSWDSLFDKYSEEVSDDIELNIDTLEPEAIVNVQWGSGHRTCMRKPVSMIQYWVDTGKPPYNVMTCDDDRSDTGSSLSEKECSTVHDNITEPNKSNEEQEGNEQESSSSVDTAVYILSNTNVTKKAETVAIVEGAKPTDMNSYKNITSEVQHTLAYSENDAHVENENILNKLSANVDNEPGICNSNTCINKNTDSKKIHNRKALCEDNRTHINSGAESARASDMLSTAQSSSNVQGNDHASATNNNKKSLGENAIDKEDFLRNISIIKKDVNRSRGPAVGDAQNNNDDTYMNCSSTTQEDYEPEIEEIYSSQKSLTSISESIKPFRRKKLFSNRNSPIDLIYETTYYKKERSDSRPSLHPALESGRIVQRKTHLARKNRVHFRKRRLQSIFSRDSFSRNDSKIAANLSIKNKKRTRRDSKKMKLSILSVTQDSSDEDSNSETEHTNVRKTLGRLEEDSRNKSDEETREESPEGKGIPSITQRDVKLTEKHPIVLLERLPQEVITHLLDEKPSTRESLSPKRKIHKDNARRSRSPRKSKTRILSRDIQKIDVDITDSDQSTILICECNDEFHTTCSIDSYMSNSEDSLHDFISPDKTVENVTNTSTPSAIDFSRYINLNPVVVLEKLDVSVYMNNKTKSKQDLTKLKKNSPKKNRRKSKVASSPKDVNRSIHEEEHVKLDVSPSKSMTKKEALPSKANGFLKPKLNVRMKTRSHDLFQRKENIFTRRESKYSFLHLPSSDEEDDITKLIETVQKDPKRNSKSMSTRARTSIENSIKSKKQARRESQTLSVNAEKPLTVMSTIIASSEEDDEDDQEKYVVKGRKRRTRAVQGEKSTSSNESLSKKNLQSHNSSDKKETVADVLHENRSRVDTTPSQANSSMSSAKSEKPRRRRRSSPKDEESKEPISLKKPRCFKTQLADSDFDSDAFISFVNSKHASLRSPKSAEKLKKSLQKKSPISDKKTDTSIEFSLREEKSEKSTSRDTRNKTVKPFVCRNLNFSDSSNSDELFVAPAAKPRSPNKNSLRVDDKKTPTKTVIEEKTNIESETSEKSLKRTRRSLRHKSSINSSAENGIVNSNIFHFQSSDDDTEVLYKKSKNISPDERSNYLKINGVLRGTVNRIERNRQSKDTDNRITNVTTKPLIFQTRPSYDTESDSD